jgi:hypothetical protein
MTRHIPLRPDPSLLREAERRSFIRACTALALGTEERGDTIGGALKALNKHWRYDDDAQRMLKAAVPPIDTTYTPSGSPETWPAIPAWEALPLIAPQAASMQLLRVGVELKLDGINILHLPYIPQSGRPTPIFVGEGQPAPLSMMTSSDQVLGPTRKILIQSALTSELQAVSAQTAERMIGEALEHATTTAMDATLFGSGAATTAAPAGLLHGVTPLTPSNVGGVISMADDLGSIAAAIAAAGIATDDVIYVANPKSATAVRVMASPKFTNTVLSSASIPTGTVIGIAPAGLYIGYTGQLELQASIETTVHFEDTAPQPIVGGTGTLAVPTRSAFQQDLIILRLRARCAWQVYPGAIQAITGAVW